MELDGAETERPARRAKKKPVRRSGAVALAAERGDLETMRVLLRLEASGTAERWLEEGHGLGGGRSSLALTFTPHEVVRRAGAGGAILEVGRLVCGGEGTAMLPMRQM